MSRGSVRHKKLWLFIKGCTNGPGDVAVSKRKARDGGYLEGMKYDVPTMLEVVEQSDANAVYNYIANMRSLKTDTVLHEIKKMAKFAYRKRCAAVSIYYTGHGEEGTGNWIFSDGVIEMKEILHILNTHWGKNNIFIYADCCYSGNWALQLQRPYYKKWNLRLLAASYPGKTTYDTVKGGAFTLMIAKKIKDSDAKCPKGCGDLRWVFARRKYKYEPILKYLKGGNSRV